MDKHRDEKPIFSPDFLTPQERQDRIVEILTRGVLRLIEKKRVQQSDINLEISDDKENMKKCLDLRYEIRPPVYRGGL